MSLRLEGLSDCSGSPDNVRHFLLRFLGFLELHFSRTSCVFPRLSSRCPLPPCPHPPLSLCPKADLSPSGALCPLRLCRCPSELGHKEAPRFAVFPRRQSHCLHPVLAQPFTAVWTGGNSFPLCLTVMPTVILGLPRWRSW